MTFRILGLDPGGTTGWGSFTSEERYDPTSKATVYTKYKFECGQIGPEPHHDELWELLELQQTDHFIIVCESFEYRNRARAGLELVSKEYIGLVNLFYRQRMQIPGQSLFFQTAAMGKVQPNHKNSFVKPRNLKRLGLWWPGHGHAMDGYGHVLFWMIHSGNIMKQELLQKGWR